MSVADRPLVEVHTPGRRPLQLVVQAPLDVGRDCDGLILVDPGVSRRHAELRPEGEKLVVTDLGSTNGTTINGQILEGSQMVGPGDVVVLGDTQIRLLDRPAYSRGATDTLGPGEVVTADEPTAGHRFQVPDDFDPRRTSIAAVATTVESERRDPTSLRGDGSTVTIVFSDIESSTEQALQLGDERWFEVLGEHNEIVRDEVGHRGGTEVKSQGDGFMLTFPSARRALDCCVEVQKRLRRREQDKPDTPLRVRMGLHTGEAVTDAEGDLFGRHIIVASRIANRAVGGQILASSVVKEIISGWGMIEFGQGLAVPLKGIDGRVVVHEVLWEEAG